MKQLVLVSMAAALLGFGAGCGDDSDAMGDGGPGGGAIEPVAETIEASAGGTVETEGAAVEIPADALSEDTEITIEVIGKSGLPNARNIASEVYDFGPDGTQFSEPVTLTIDFDPSDTPDGMRAVIAWLDDEEDAWVPLADSKVQGRAVTATTDHFTPFAVIFTAGGQTAGQCEDVGDTDCGGDLVGTWEFNLACLTLPPDFLEDDEGQDPFADCGGATFRAVTDFSGTISFTEDGQYELNTMQTTDIVIEVPKACLMGMPCSALAGDDGENEVRDAGEHCEVIRTESSTNEETGTYETEGGNTVYTMEEGDTEPGEPTRYCIDGDTLTASVTDADNGVETVFQATRR